MYFNYNTVEELEMEIIIIALKTSKSLLEGFEVSIIFSESISVHDKKKIVYQDRLAWLSDENGSAINITKNRNNETGWKVDDVDNV